MDSVNVQIKNEETESNKSSAVFMDGNGHTAKISRDMQKMTEEDVGDEKMDFSEGLKRFMEIEERKQWKNGRKGPPREEDVQLKHKCLAQSTASSGSESVEQELQQSLSGKELKNEEEFISELISVAGLSNEEMFRKFNLCEFSIQLKRLDAEDIAQFCGRLKGEITKRNWKRSERALSSSSGFERDDEPSEDERLSGRKEKRMMKRWRKSLNNCYVCHRSLNETVGSWADVLGEKSIYCSLACVQKQVDQAKALISDCSSTVMLLDRYGTMLNGPAAPTVDTLYEFLCSHAEFTPVLPSYKNTERAEEEKSKKDHPNFGSFCSKDTDQRRLQVRRAIADKLLGRARKTPNLQYSSNALKALSQEIEQELYMQCQQTISDKYRSWFKRFYMNLSDNSNKGLYLRVIIGDISVPSLVSTDPNELSSPALSSPVEIKKRRAKGKLNDTFRENVFEQIVDETCKNNMIDAMMSKGSEQVANASPEKQKPCMKETKSMVEGKSEIDKILGIEPMNATPKHESHFFNISCEICMGKRVLKEKLKTRGKTLEAKKKIKQEQVHPVASAWNGATNFESAQALLRPENREKSNLDIREMSFSQQNESWRRHRSNCNEEKSQNTWRTNVNDKLHLSTWRVKDSDRRIVAGSLPIWASESNVRPTENWRDFTRPVKSQNAFKDGFFDEAANDRKRDLRNVWEREEQHIVWEGVVTMAQLFTFTTTLTVINNERAFYLRNELQSVIQVIGRIKPAAVSDYLDSVCKSKDKDVVVLQLDKPTDSRMQGEYVKCFQDMQARERYCVLASKHIMLKDAFLMSVGQNEELPAALLPFNGPGIPAIHPPLIICVIVRFTNMVSALADRAADTAASSKVDSKLGLPTLSYVSKHGLDSSKEIQQEHKSRASSPIAQHGRVEFKHKNSCFLHEVESVDLSETVYVKGRRSRNTENAEMQNRTPAEFEERNVKLEKASMKASVHTFEGCRQWRSLATRSSKKKDSKQRSSFIDPSSRLSTINSASDFHSLHSHDTLSEITVPVSKHNERSTLTPEEEKMIERTVQQKVSLEIKKEEDGDNMTSLPKTENTKLDDRSRLEHGKDQQSGLNNCSFNVNGEMDSTVGHRRELVNVQTFGASLQNIRIPPEDPIFAMQSSLSSPPLQPLPAMSVQSMQFFSPLSQLTPPPPLLPLPLGTCVFVPNTLPVPVTSHPSVVSNTFSSNCTYSSSVSSDTIGSDVTSVNSVTSIVPVITISKAESVQGTENQDVAGEMDMDISDDESSTPSQPSTVLPAFNIPPFPSLQSNGTEVKPLISPPSTSLTPSPYPAQLPLPLPSPVSGTSSLRFIQKPVQVPATASYTNHNETFLKNDAFKRNSGQPYKDRELKYQGNSYINPVNSRFGNSVESCSYTSSVDPKNQQSHVICRTKDSRSSSNGRNSSSASRNGYSQRYNSGVDTHYFFKDYTSFKQSHKTPRSSKTSVTLKKTGDWKYFSRWTTNKQFRKWKKYDSKQNPQSRTTNSGEIHETSTSSNRLSCQFSTKSATQPFYERPSTFHFNAFRNQGRKSAFPSTNNYW